MNPILFLSFNGVTHPGTRPTFDRMLMLQLWLLERPTVDVVISAKNRRERSLSQTRALFDFSPKLHPRVLDYTPELPVSSPFARQAEIERWLALNGRRSARIAALDDDASLFNPDCAWLVRTASHEALMGHHLDLLDKLLVK